jgi:hypothetical protein
MDRAELRESIKRAYGSARELAAPDIARLAVAGLIAGADALHPNPKIPKDGIFYLAEEAINKVAQLGSSREV